MQLVSQTVHSLSGYAFLHDFAVTPQHYVVFQNPVRLSLAPFILGQQGPAQCVDWAEGEPMQVATSLLRCTQPLLWGRAHQLLTVMSQSRQKPVPPAALQNLTHLTLNMLRCGEAQRVEALPACMKGLGQCISCRLHG